MDGTIPHKVCFKCGRDLPLYEFYKLKTMADGHLNKCKSCTKTDVHNLYRKKLKDPSFVEKERARGRDKYRRLYGNFNPELFETRPKEKHFEEYQDKKCKNARRSVIAHQPWLTLPEATQVHHWCYREPFQIFIVSMKTHYAIHHLTRYLQDENCFADLQTGEKLDTVEKYKEWLGRHWFFYGYKDVSEPLYGVKGCNKTKPD